ncbi:hypothetical protein OFD51_34825, partial [Escherichia coli]|nr:hypothetical protein [Escherichia coli]
IYQPFTAGNLSPQGAQRSSDSGFSACDDQDGIASFSSGGSGQICGFRLSERFQQRGAYPVRNFYPRKSLTSISADEFL